MHGILGLALLALPAALPVASPALANAVPAISLSQTTGSSLAVTKVSGAGFRGRESVTIYFDRVVVGAATTDATGELLPATILIPSMAAAGDHVVSVVGTQGDDASVGFLVANPVTGQLIADSFHSRALDSRLRFAVYLPPGYASMTTRYPVVYFLHGLPATPWLYRSRLVFVARNLEMAGQKAIVVVPQSVRPGDSDAEYHDWGPGRDWETAIAIELPRVIDHRYRTIPTRDGRGLIGLSAGGYGAILLGLRHRGVFSALESWSGYFRATDPSGQHTLVFGTARADADASAYSYIPALSHDASNLPTFIAFYVGTADTTFLADNQRFDAALTAARVPHEFDLYPGGHDYALWQTEASAWLQLALQHLATPQSLAMLPLPTGSAGQSSIAMAGKSCRSEGETVTSHVATELEMRDGL